MDAAGSAHLFSNRKLTDNLSVSFGQESQIGYGVHSDSNLPNYQNPDAEEDSAHCTNLFRGQIWFHLKYQNPGGGECFFK